MKKKKPKTIGDCAFDGEPECFHCERKMPKHTPVSFDGPYVIAQCVFCGLMTPFKGELEVHESPVTIH